MELVDGFLRYQYRSKYVDSIGDYGDTYNFDVLLPDDYSPSNQYPLIISLGVEKNPGELFTYEMSVIRDGGFHNTYDSIFCQVTTKSDPWWSVRVDGHMDYEKLLVQGVVPWMRANYSIIAGVDGVSLLGWSKGGWGAISLMLRNPTVFGYAAAWDSPMTQTRAYLEGPLNNGADWGSDAVYEAFAPHLILPTLKAGISNKTRFVHSGASFWVDEVDDFEAQLDSESVPHVYLATNPAWPHDADGGWMPGVMAALVGLWP